MGIRFSWSLGRRQGVLDTIEHFLQTTGWLFYQNFGIIELLHLTLYLYCSLHSSVFGEDALVNVSVEKKDDNDGKLAGYIRIRSKTQGIALSLGDRITSVQRGLPPNKNE